MSPILRDKLVSLGELVELKLDEVLIEEGGNVNYIYLPYSGYISLVATVDQHAAMEIAIVGREGMLAASLLSGISPAPFLAVVYGPGNALKIDALTFQKKCETSSTLRLFVKQSISLQLAQLVSTATCAKFHAIKPRLSKRLLQVHDRVQTDCFYVTHRVLANLLGVRRSAVSIAAISLQQHNCIRYSRGIITILDRKLLEAEACSCYESIIGA
jgi:CRP-like cAMP-binding protein